jgi:hypothetical protein
MKSKWKIALYGIATGVMFSFFGSFVFSAILPIYFVIIDTVGVRVTVLFLLDTWIVAFLFSLAFTCIPAVLAGIALAFSLAGREQSAGKATRKGAIWGSVAGLLVPLLVIFVILVPYFHTYVLLWAGVAILVSAGMGALGARWLSKRLEKIA